MVVFKSNYRRIGMKGRDIFINLLTMLHALFLAAVSAGLPLYGKHLAGTVVRFCVFDRIRAQRPNRSDEDILSPTLMVIAHAPRK